ncbi:MAG TPA: multicopper oxidase domain-containing protein [Bryobacteraceae bacterium]|nr:multicopper oxidase domain-containing protein [Bryobacteraceae bacterium]
MSVELSPKKIVKTIGYNGTSPGPLLRMKEGKPVTIDVFNDTSRAELVHWHGLHIPSEVDGAMEEGTPMISPRGHARYTFTPAPSGTRWYHTHTAAGRDLTKATYSGQFGFLYIDPKQEPGAYDQEVFLALREWEPYMTSGNDDEGSLDPAWKAFSINGHALGWGEPVRVKEGQRIMVRILNASATQHRRIAFAGHGFRVVAMDGNAVSSPAMVEALELGPAERIDAIIEMNQPGIWVLGATDDHDRTDGMGIVFEYAGQTGQPRWVTPSAAKWDYTVFGTAQGVLPDAEKVPLVFRKVFAGHRWVDKWSINGKIYPKTDPIRLKAGGRYRLIFDNRSDEAHPVHLHRHTFELTKVEGVATSGVLKDVVVVQPMTQIEADFVANNRGPTLFHCHQQMHMDYGFMALLKYA